MCVGYEKKICLNLTVFQTLHHDKINTYSIISLHVEEGDNYTKFESARQYSHHPENV